MSHLEPPDCVFDTPRIFTDYALAVARQLLPSDEDGHVVASTFCLPSFEFEWAVFLLVSSTRKYSLRFSTAARPIWGRELNHNVRVHSIDRDVSDEIATRIAGAFDLALGKVRYRNKHRLCCDGTTLHFSAGGRSGQTWSPPPDTIPGVLTSLALAMRNYARESQDQTDSGVAAMLQAIEWIEANHSIEPVGEAEDPAPAEFMELDPNIQGHT